MLRSMYKPTRLLRRVLSAPGHTGQSACSRGSDERAAIFQNSHNFHVQLLYYTAAVTLVLEVVEKSTSSAVPVYIAKGETYVPGMI